MGTCGVCRHELRPAIDAALVAGGSLLAVAGRFGFGVVALKRHRARHLPRALVAAAEAAQVAQRGSLRAQLEDMQRRARAYEAAAHAAGDRRAALLALREGRATAELIARLCPEALMPAGRYVAEWAGPPVCAQPPPPEVVEAEQALVRQGLELSTAGGDALPAGSGMQPAPATPTSAPTPSTTAAGRPRG